MSDKDTSREAFEKWMQDKAPKGIDIHSAWEVWLAALAHSAQAGSESKGEWVGAKEYWCAPQPAQQAPVSAKDEIIIRAADTLDDLGAPINAKELRGLLPVSAQMTDEQAVAFADQYAVFVENAYIGYTGEHLDHGAAYAIAKELAQAILSTAHSQQVRVMTDELPPLPEADYAAGTKGMLGENCYTADQMREYARLAISTAHSSERDKALEEAAKECERMARHLDLHGASRCASAIRALKSQPSSLPQQVEDKRDEAIADTKRLDFITTFGRPWSVQWMKKGDKPVRYRMIDDGEPWGQWHSTARAAIDAALSAQEKGGE